MFAGIMIPLGKDKKFSLNLADRVQEDLKHGLFQNKQHADQTGNID
jgi:hypothetical protein